MGWLDDVFGEVRKVVSSAFGSSPKKAAPRKAAPAPARGNFNPSARLDTSQVRAGRPVAVQPHRAPDYGPWHQAVYQRPAGADPVRFAGGVDQSLPQSVKAPKVPLKNPDDFQVFGVDTPRGGAALPGSTVERLAKEADESKASTRKAEMERHNAELGIEGPQTADVNLDVSSQVHDITTAEYLSMSPRQQAVVDYNTLLSDAIKRDFQNQDTYSKWTQTEQADYKKLSTDLFGKTRGSDVLAPETLEVIDQLNLKDSVSDLDEYLNLKKIVQDSDLGNLTNEARSPLQGALNEAKPVTGVENPRYEFSNRIADRIESAMAEGSQLLQQFNPAAMSLSGDADTDTLYRQAFEALADSKGPDSKLVLGDIPADKLEGFMAYANSRSLQSLRYNTPLNEEKTNQTTGEPIKSRSAVDLRKLLGFSDEVGVQ